MVARICGEDDRSSIEVLSKNLESKFYFKGLDIPERSMIRVMEHAYRHLLSSLGSYLDPGRGNDVRRICVLGRLEQHRQLDG